VKQSVNGLLKRDGIRLDEQRKQIVELLRDIEMSYAVSTQDKREVPWEQFSRLVKENLGEADRTPKPTDFTPTPKGFGDDEEDGND
jgi:hypothetical protein